MLRNGVRRKIRAALRFPVVRLAGFPTLANVEVTRTCNARCDFCRYWALKGEERLDDYAPVVKRLRPAVVMLTGGEALLRRDLENIVWRIRAECPWVYLGLVTNGWLLTVDRARNLRAAGVEQLAVSLDFLDERHDEARGLPGLAKRVMNTVAEIVDRGLGPIVLQTVIKAENLASIPDIVLWAQALGVRVSLSAYTSVKTGNAAHLVGGAQMDELRRLIQWLTELRTRSSTIVSSSYYLSKVSDYFERGGIPGCQAGRRFVTVRPDGRVQPCSELEQPCDHARWNRGTFSPVTCASCWVSCRGESQAPLDWERVKLAASFFGRPVAEPPPHAPRYS